MASLSRSLRRDNRVGSVLAALWLTAGNSPDRAVALKRAEALERAVALEVSRSLRDLLDLRAVALERAVALRDNRPTVQVSKAVALELHLIWKRIVVAIALKLAVSSSNSR